MSRDQTTLIGAQDATAYRLYELMLLARNREVELFPNCEDLPVSQIDLFHLNAELLSKSGDKA